VIFAFFHEIRECLSVHCESFVSNRHLSIALVQLLHFLHRPLIEAGAPVPKRSFASVGIWHWFRPISRRTMRARNLSLRDIIM
jgi:hypothetical protein